MADADEMRAARERLADAILDVDRLIAEEAGEQRGPGELMTHWIVAYSFLRAEGSDDSTQVSEIRSSGMTYWMAAGLAQSVADAALGEPYRDDDE